MLRTLKAFVFYTFIKVNFPLTPPQSDLLSFFLFSSVMKSRSHLSTAEEHQARTWEFRTASQDTKYKHRLDECIHTEMAIKNRKINKKACSLQLEKNNVFYFWFILLRIRNLSTNTGVECVIYYLLKAFFSLKELRPIKHWQKRSSL